MHVEEKEMRTCCHLFVEDLQEVMNSIIMCAIHCKKLNEEVIHNKEKKTRQSKEKEEESY